MLATSCVPRRDHGDSAMVGRNGVAAPNNMQIGPNQDQVVAVNLSSGIVVDLNKVKLRTKLCKGLAKRGQSFVVPTKTDECELATNSIVHRLAVVEPDVRQS